MSPEWLQSIGLPGELVVLITSALPILELRGGIPVAMGLLDFPWYYAFLLGVIGNLLPVPFILLFLDYVTRMLSKVRFFDRILNWLFERTRRRGKIIQKYERIGLVLFVAIPLPVTGAWTGALAAVIFGMRFKYAFLSILIGVLIAGVIVTCLSYFGLAIIGMWQA
ncbi:MAG: small multi-drug export protein [Dehalococcoidales bacterium]|nr:MAG: small multi-drug export protein [Dehalococcoidales bacterium]